MSSGAFEGKALLIKRVTDANNADLNRLSSVCVYVCFVVSPLGGVVIFFNLAPQDHPSAKRRYLELYNFICCFSSSLSAQLL